MRYTIEADSGGVTRYSPASRANPLRNPGRSRMVYGAATRKAIAEAAIVASALFRREGSRRDGHPAGEQRHDDGDAAAVFRRRRQPGCRAGHREGAHGIALVSGQGQQEGQRHEKGLQRIGQHVVRVPDVQRDHGQQPGPQQRMASAPAHADLKNQQHGRHAEGRRDGAAPQIEVPAADLCEGAPLPGDRAGQESDDRHDELDVDAEAGIVEEALRVERAAPHHVERPLDDLGFVDLDGVGNAAADGPEAQDRRRDQHNRQRHLRRAQIARLAPLALNQSRRSPRGVLSLLEVVSKSPWSHGLRPKSDARRGPGFINGPDPPHGSGDPHTTGGLRPRRHPRRTRARQSRVPRSPSPAAAPDPRAPR